jgi:hypothetical protein
MVYECGALCTKCRNADHAARDCPRRNRRAVRLLEQADLFEIEKRKRPGGIPVRKSAKMDIDNLVEKKKKTPPVDLANVPFPTGRATLQATEIRMNLEQLSCLSP